MNKVAGQQNGGVRILGIDFTEPFDMKTFSGSSYHIWTTLKAKGVLVDAFTPRPSGAGVTYYKLLSFRPGWQKWKANWHRSVSYREHLSTRASKIISTRETDSFNATLQIGAYYDLSSSWTGYRALLADNNCVISQATNVNFRSSERAFHKQYEFEKKVYRSMNNIFCFSTYLAKSFVKDFGCDERKVSVVYAGINIDEQLISSTEKDYDSKTVLFSAFDFENKGGNILLKAFEKVTKEIPDTKLVLLGPAEGSFPDYVTNHGPLSKSNPKHLEIMARCYKKASIFVHPTLADAFPNVVREAMAARLPCVATDMCGIPDMVEDGVTGYLIPLADSDTLAERLITLLNNPEACLTMGEAGYKKYRDQFTWDQVCSKIIEVVASGVAKISLESNNRE